VGLDYSISHDDLYFTHFPANDSFILLYGWVKLHYVYIPLYCHTFLIHSAIDGHLNWFHNSVIVNSAAINMGMPVSL
jgi:hypothetical protein